LPTGKQQDAECVRNVVDYSKASPCHGERSGSLSLIFIYLQPSMVAVPATNAKMGQSSLAHSCLPSHSYIAAGRYGFYSPPNAAPCSPSHDASFGSCCDFSSMQSLMRSID